MTANRDPDRLLRAWLDLMPHEAPDRVIESVLHATTAAPQARVLPWLGRRRSQPMNRLVYLGAAAAIVVVLVGGAMIFKPTANNGNRPSSTPVPTATPIPTATPNPSLEPTAAMPAAVWGDWHATGVNVPNSTLPHLVRLSLAWQDGLAGWIQIDDDGLGRQVLNFVPIEAPAGELRLRATTAEGCALSDVGHYRWHRSTDGLFLTLDVIEDPCPARVSAFARTWVHSLSAVTDGGLGVIPFDPWIRVSLPRQRMGMGGGANAPEIKTFGDAQPFRAFVLIKNPGGFGAPCADSDPGEIGIAHTRAAFVAYMKAFPGATVTTSTKRTGAMPDGSLTIAGRPATRVSVAIDAGLTCRADGAQAFHAEDLADAFAWAFSPGESQALYIVQFDASTTILVWYQGPAGEEQAVRDSITFLDQLPSPA